MKTMLGNRLKQWMLVPSLLSVMVVAADGVAATLATFAFTGLAGGEASAAPDADSVATGLSVSPMTRGPGITAAAWPSASDSFHARDFRNDNPLDPGQNEYFTFTITPAPSRTLDLGTIAFRWARSGSGPYRFSLRTSIEGWDVNLQSGTAPATPTVTFPNTAAYNAITGPVEVRFYGYNAPATSHYGLLDDVVITGTVVGPSPGTAILLR